MMKLTMLGTGNAVATECYNTCFVMQQNDSYLLVDGGGGNTLFKQLKEAQIDWKKINNIFVTHKHVDHLFGIIWMLRLITQSMQKDEYPGDVNLYGHAELLETIKNLTQTLLSEKHFHFIEKRVHLIPVDDGEELEIIGCKIQFFDTNSAKVKQYGFLIHINDNEKLICFGDERYNEKLYEYAKGCTWMMHEAFCLYSDIDYYKPYRIHHSTVKDACEIAEMIGIKNLIIYHTEDDNLANRKELYSAEGKQFFKGNLFIPDDLESFEF